MFASLNAYPSIYIDLINQIYYSIFILDEWFCLYQTFMGRGAGIAAPEMWANISVCPDTKFGSWHYFLTKI